MPDSAGDTNEVHASIVINRQVLNDERALDATYADLRRMLRDQATERGRWVSGVMHVVLTSTPRTSVRWWQVFNKQPPQLYRLTASAPTELL